MHRLPPSHHSAEKQHNTGGCIKTALTQESLPRETRQGFFVTILYIIFWSMFSVISRKYEPLVNTSFAISLITFISATAGLTARLINGGGFITALLSIFSSIPFYGVRLFIGWTDLYAVSTILSLCWLIYTWYTKCKLKRTLTARQ